MKQSSKYLKIFCNLIVVVLVLCFFIYILPGLIVYFMPFVVGLILSFIANPVIKFLEKKIKIKRKYGSALIIILVIGVIVLICYGVGSALMAGIKSFSDYAPTMYKNAETELNAALEQLQNLLNRVPFLNGIDLDRMAQSVEQFIGDLMSGSGEPTVIAIGGFAKGIPNMLVSVIVGLLATYFFIADREKVIELADKYMSHSFREKTGRIYGQIRKVVGGYFKAQFKIMGVIYVVLTVGLLILGVDYAWLIGFGIAFLDMLPVFGTGTVLCPWAVVKLFSGNYAVAVGMLALYAVTLIVHQAVQPKLVGETIGMDPFAALFFMYVGYRVSSVIGMIVAIPVGMLLINLYQAGAFDTAIWCVKEIIHDFNQFRKIKKE